MIEKIRIGTRRSALARRQTGLVRDRLLALYPRLQVEVETISTAGDELQAVPIALLGDKGAFVRNLERALLDGRIDAAVHSLKDVPSDVEVHGLELLAFPERADPRDALISRRSLRLRELPGGARVGTSSLRRRALLLQFRPDLRPLDIRGNVDTRLRKLDAGDYDALVLAAAGLHRLGLQERIVEYLPVDSFVPDAGQGILAVQTRVGNAVAAMVRSIDLPSVRLAALAERAALRTLGADCRSPVGVHAVLNGGRIHVTGAFAPHPDSSLYRDSVEGPAEEAETVGRALGNRLLDASRA